MVISPCISLFHKYIILEYFILVFSQFLLFSIFSSKYFTALYIIFTCKSSLRSFFSNDFFTFLTKNSASDPNKCFMMNVLIGFFKYIISLMYHQLAPHCRTPTLLLLHFLPCHRLPHYAHNYYIFWQIGDIRHYPCKLRQYNCSLPPLLRICCSLSSRVLQRTSSNISTCLDSGTDSLSTSVSVPTFFGGFTEFHQKSLSNPLFSSILSGEASPFSINSTCCFL